MRKAFNLTAFFIAKKGYRQERELEEIYRDCCSILSDLEEAERSLLKFFDATLDANSRRIYGRALMCHAIIAYMRATDQKYRKKVTSIIHQKFDAECKENHICLKTLRDNVIAHHDKAVTYRGKTWIDDTVVVRIIDEAYDVFDVKIRTNYLEDAINDLFFNVSSAIEIVNELRVESQSNLRTEIARRLSNREKMLDDLEQFKFDPDEYYKNYPINVEKVFWQENEAAWGEKFTPPLAAFDNKKP